MRFMIIVPSDSATDGGAEPVEQMYADMQAYNEEMLKAGVFVDGQGLHPAEKGTRISWDDDGEVVVTDGPFAEAKELIAGFTIIEVSSKEEALAWVRKWPASCAPTAGHALELRQVMGPDDFGDEFTPELQQREAQMREEAARNATQG